MIGMSSHAAKSWIIAESSLHIQIMECFLCSGNALALSSVWKYRPETKGCSYARAGYMPGQKSARVGCRDGTRKGGTVVSWTFKAVGRLKFLESWCTLIFQTG